MNVNGARFHMLLGPADWGACRGGADGATALADAWKAGATNVPVYDEARAELALAPLDEPIAATKGEAVFTPADHRSAAADRNGNLYMVADDRMGLLVRSAGDGRVTAFWPAAAPRPGRRSAFDDAVPAAAVPDVLTGLAVTDRDFLVAGFIAADGAGLLRFDLVGGGPPQRYLLPPGTIPAALAPATHGGLWLLDTAGRQLLRLDADLAVAARPMPDAPATFTTLGEKPADATRAQPIAVALAAAPDAAAIVALADDSLVLLDAPPLKPARLFLVEAGAPSLPPPLVLDFPAVAMALLDKDGSPALFVADADGNQARRFALARENGHWTIKADTATLPMRRFGGRALVAISGLVHYDSGATAPIWVPVVEIRHRRYAREAAFVTSMYDGGEPQCVWDRVRLDGCIPPGSAIAIEARAADAPAALAGPGGWVAQPALLLSATGSELTDKRPAASLVTDAAKGKGTWGLLLQNVVGRFCQLRVTIAGDGRLTPRLRALRLWYPRFSYVERFLPGLYREDPVSASFLERFLANFEGIDTGIEDRIATIEALFDPRTAPGGMLEWLASWFEVALDPSWDERRRRLFIANAVSFFGWRGTVRGLQLALKLALDPAVDARDFDLAAPARPSPRGIRISEAFVARKPWRRFPAGNTAKGPAMHSLADPWTPEDGRAGLWARWPEQPAPGGPFPLTPIEHKEAIWAAFAEAQFGFVPQAGQSEAPRWRAFLRARYRSAADLASAHAGAWEDFDAVPLPTTLPPTAAGIRDWLAFEGRELPIAAAAHRFSVLLPRTRVDEDPDEEARRLALAARIVALEKPAHTVFDVRFYWAMNCVGAARLGLDSAIGRGSRAPELVPGAVLGRAYLGAGFVGGPDAPGAGRERVAC